MSEFFTDTRNGARPNSARASGTRSAGGTSLACDSLAGWPVSPRKVHFVTYQIDSNSVPVAGTQLDCTGIVTTNTINSFTVIDGNDTGNSVNDVVEMLPTAAWGQDLSDGLNVLHNRDGTWKSGAALTLPTIADHTNAQHTHQNAAAGGVLAASALGTDASWAWTAYTPAVTLTGGTTNGNAVITGASTRIGKTVHFWVSYALGSTTNFGGLTDITCTLPVTMSAGFVAGATQMGVGSAAISGTAYQMTALVNNTTTFRLGYIVASFAAAAHSQVSPTTPGAWVANASSWNITGTYEAA